MEVAVQSCFVQSGFEASGQSQIYLGLKFEFVLWKMDREKYILEMKLVKKCSRKIILFPVRPKLLFNEKLFQNQNFKFWQRFPLFLNCENKK